MSGLFTPFTLRGVTFKNRVAVSPMSQYRAADGIANDWHLVHLGRFATGGAGLVFAEATAVENRGKRTHGDLGLWDDRHIAPLKQIADFIKQEGSVPGIQLSHAGRKASERRPWHGETPVDDTDVQERSESPWPAIAPSALPYATGWPTPSEMRETDIQAVIDAFGAAARRAHLAGFEVIEIYAAHGFLVHQFLSPIANQRGDKWGGSFENRARFACEVAKAVRASWPETLPLSFRLSGTDWLDGGLEIDDIVRLSKLLGSLGVDIIDCSSGGIGGKDRPRRMTISQGFQVPFAQQVRQETGLPTIAVGFLWDAHFCDQIVRNGQADMIALARELLDDPNWPLHAAQQLRPEIGHDAWPTEFGWWLDKRDRLLTKLGLRSGAGRQ
ncbi:NADH:flavin oxidoreductase/NADH oxidase [uncultured Tateyamaria sp.]|uniref:NADH:flavin oxidoreductase/NADH oxidase n=1 Tax=uncultured Tateyamaria sp. TaxID=455651 RepID=UPI002625EB41|nr:NADH:flavin oxidoreductase/NADH oxidase [uncultured Tateyamaria sp.]